MLWENIYYENINIQRRNTFLSWANITQEAPGKINREDDGERKQTHYSHEKDDVTLKRQVHNSINATLSPNLFISADSRKTAQRNKYNIITTAAREKNKS